MPKRRKLILVVAIGALSSVGSAQSSAAISDTEVKAVPETVEYSILLLTLLRDSTEAMDRYAERKGAMLDETGLRFEHQQALVDVAEAYGGGLQALALERRRAGTSISADQFKEQRASLVGAAISQLRARLGSEGVEQLKSFIALRISPSIETIEGDVQKEGRK